MQNKKKSNFDRVFSSWDILVIAFGAMIGWGFMSALTARRVTAQIVWVSSIGELDNGFYQFSRLITH